MAHVIAGDSSAQWRERERQTREDVVRFGLWIFLATVTMLFAAFTSAYIVRRSTGDWRPVALPSLLWVNTVVLVLSSAAVEAARWAGGRNRWRPASVAFGVAVGLGVGFLVGQWLGWKQLTAAGVYLPTSAHGSFFYMMTGAHALHVLAALAVLAWTAVATWSGMGQRRPREWRLQMSVCRTFWHYLGVVWVYLLVFLSVY
jgi:cytochrome c oxidase subunit 3